MNTRPHSATADRPQSAAELKDLVLQHPRVLPTGGGSKPSLSAPRPGWRSVSLSAMSGIIEYDPEEFTFTASAGTPIAKISAALREHGQYMPFDPPLVRAGATLGGTVAAGINGPGRTRYGGVRDFILGVRLLDGRGREITGGGKVVKNAAGFDLPKLMVGSLGRLGILTEITFKVFPSPQAFGTLRLNYPDPASALAALVKLSRSSFDLEALEFEPPGTLWARIGGDEAALTERLESMERFVESRGERLLGGEDDVTWRRGREFAWRPPSGWLVKVPLTPKRIPGFDAVLARDEARRRYGASGQVAWVAWPADVARLDQLLRSMDLSGLVLFGPVEHPWIGVRKGRDLALRAKGVLDPDNRFPTL